jgi:hypothetical protein
MRLVALFAILTLLPSVAGGVISELDLTPANIGPPFHVEQEALRGDKVQVRVRVSFVDSLPGLSAHFVIWKEPVEPRPGSLHEDSSRPPSIAGCTVEGTACGNDRCYTVSVLRDFASRTTLTFFVPAPADIPSGTAYQILLGEFVKQVETDGPPNKPLQPTAPHGGR